MPLPTHFRVVAVPLPRPSSLGGRILGILDANVGRPLTAKEIAARLQVDDVALVRAALSFLKCHGLAIGRTTPERDGRQPVWNYEAAVDLTAYLPPAIAAKAAA